MVRVKNNGLFSAYSLLVGDLFRYMSVAKNFQEHQEEDINKVNR